MKRKYRVIRDNGKVTVKFEPSMNKKHSVFKELSKIMVNIGLLTFTSLVLGSIIKGDYDRLTIICIGGGVAVLFIVSGIIIFTTGGE